MGLQTFADYGDAAFGRRGRRLVYLCAYTCIFFEPVILQIICTQNLVQILHRYGISQVGWNVTDPSSLQLICM